LNSRVPNNFGFYAILTNPKRGYDYTAHILVDHEVPFIQLRIKDTTEYNVLRIAEKLSTITEGTLSQLIINDYPRVALDSGANGVHVGQDDMPFEQVREMAGPDLLIGLSTHNLEQTIDACKKMPDYIGIGPVYATPTKKIPDPVLGIEGMKEMLDKATVPAVCIGGISLERLPEVLKAGAKIYCMVRPVCEADDPGKVVKNIIKVFNDYK
jgi:thiamine-phosphate pyrophosphorylase